ncbi:FitA-like ribbon-helix-helix domain-containing protein [Roseobacter sp. HKCCA0434]|uniref:FitA-like ribbon-helix-helix domain-containing protein n=1 Tax=Roseobacter sp. HKCCA0434 TaxID=3079297 RepID=UPI002905AE13|nr:hypothetical protein [Roseobacter sp. HKCCA0434]
MGSMTVRNIPEDDHNNLKLAAKLNGRSVEEEVRRMIAREMKQRFGGGLGATMRACWAGMTDEPLVIERSQDDPRPVDFT